MTKADIAWTIARSAFAKELARIEDDISEYAWRLLNMDGSSINQAARHYAPNMLHAIRRAKIERAITRRVNHD